MHGLRFSRAPSLQIIKQHRDNGVWSHPEPSLRDPG